MKLLKSILLFVVSIAAEGAVNVCYYTNWAQYRAGPGKFTPDKIDPTLCTHINYAFAFVSEAGTELNAFEWNDYTEWGDGGMYKQVTDLKKVNPNLKVVLSVGGWTHGTGGFSPAAATAASRQIFAQNALNFVKAHNFDGIDVDWEYPGFATHPTKPGFPEDVENHVRLLEQLKEIFQNDGKILTAALGAPPSRVDESYPATQRICEALDLVHLMTYDFHGGWENVIGHHAAFVTDGKHPDDSEGSWSVKSSVNYWIDNGCPAEKITLGLGSYGRGFRATTDKVDRLAPGTAVGVKGDYTRTDGFLAYYEVCNWDKYIDPAIQSAVAIKDDLWVGFESVESAEVKLDFVVEKHLAGIMWWALDMDDFDGVFCGKGKYPLISNVWASLQEKSLPEPTLATTSIGTTSTMTSGTSATTVSSSVESTSSSSSLPSTSSIPSTSTIPPTMSSTSIQSTTTSRDSQVDIDINDLCRVKDDGYWAHPNNCHQYIQCVHNGALAIERTCGNDLLWNSLKMVCDWPYNVQQCAQCECNSSNYPEIISTTLKGSTTSKIVTRTQTPSTPPKTTTTASSNIDNLCKHLSNEFRPYPNDCTKFIQCYNGNTYVKNCPTGTVWNHSGWYCDWPANVPGC